MGNGISGNTDAENHLRRWEKAIADLSTLCKDHRRTLAGYVSPVPALDDEATRKKDSVGGGVQPQGSAETRDVESRGSEPRRRTSSSVSFNKQAGATATAPTTAPTTAPQQQVHVHSPERHDRTSTVDVHADAPSSGKVDTPSNKHSRQQIQEARKARLELYKSYVAEKKEDLQDRLSCDHFAVVAAALSYLLGGPANASDRKTKVTVEDLFFSAQIPLHALHRNSCALTEMYDYVREFIDVDNRLRGNYTVEVVHFDIAPAVGEVDIGGNEVGDRQTKIVLSDFRKAIQADLESDDPRSVRILKFDPFIVEQAMLLDEGDDEEENDGGEGDAFMKSSFCASNLLTPKATMITRPTEKERYKKENEGQFAVLLDFRQAVQPMVTLALGIVADKIHVQFEEVPLNALFKAMRAAKPGSRAMGYIKVTQKKAEDATKLDVPLLFSPELASGKVLGTTDDGMHAHIISQLISPHIIACGWALHLLRGPRPDSHRHGQGLCVTDIIRTLKLPCDIFLQCDLPLDQVNLYFLKYLQAKGLSDSFHVTLCPILTKISRDDAVPTLSVFELDALLIEVKNANEDPEEPSSVMILQYNAEVAHNALGIASQPQWAILAGYDEERQVALLIDANPKRFCATWTCRVERLHKAITNYGYIMVNRPSARKTRSLASSRSSSSPREEEVGALRHITSAVKMRLDAVTTQAFSTDRRGAVEPFTFPKEPLGITQMAAALTWIGLPTAVHDIFHSLPFDTSSLLGSYFGLRAYHIAFGEYLSTAHLADSFELQPYFADSGEDNKCTLTPHGLALVIKECLASKPGSGCPNPCVLTVHYSRQKLNVFGAEHPYGEYGIVTDIHPSFSAVTVSDVNPNSFFRTWQVDLSMLHAAVTDTSVEGNRGRGYLILRKRPAPPVKPATLQSRDFSLAHVPLQHSFKISPCAHVQGLSIAFAQLGHFYSPEEIFYEAFLKTMTDQRRRGSQAYAWRDVEVSLAVLNRKITAPFMVQMVKKFLDSRKVYTIGVELVEDIEIAELPKLLIAGTAPDADHVLVLNYDTRRVHTRDSGNSVALLRAYDTATKTVTMMEGEYCLLGLTWTVSLEGLVEAGDLDNEGRSSYGFVKLFKKSGDSAGSPTSRFGGFKGFAEDPNANGGGAGERPESPRRGRTVFL